MIGCLCIHGFTGEAKEVEPLTNFLKKKRNWLVYSPTLPGHGSRDGLKKATFKQWLYAAEVAVEELLNRCHKVYVLGFSMGSMIATHIASKYPIHKLVLLSASAYYLNPKQIVEDMKGWIIEGWRGELRSDALYRLYRKKVKNTPLKATIEFAKIVYNTRPILKKVIVPTLIVQGECDGLVPAKKSAEYIYETISSTNKQLYYFKNSKHYIWLGEEREKLLSIINNFLEQ
ncbi:carboxylesterase [Anaerobacillus alkalidiazotrophicus]|uniref:Carboxylesterase n=1 Tax=Anaerobacillus alkalidiazotrophicus TaxID=472963 RepID=A0A1S2M014_9BACI|nr:alpha/beta fold hydrolase [Anaerobacillus alkalidiazotrophicus]OIJ18029.1 carboxylesterase [Anaerobacillus alkalidiazotrophicus]OIJ19509.1 carboxylesterase [Anaerobacillus alkalidiazotrophicus]